MYIAAFGSEIRLAHYLSLRSKAASAMAEEKAPEELEEFDDAEWEAIADEMVRINAEHQKNFDKWQRKYNIEEMLREMEEHERQHQILVNNFKAELQRDENLRKCYKEVIGHNEEFNDLLTTDTEEGRSEQRDEALRLLQTLEGKLPTGAIKELCDLFSEPREKTTEVGLILWIVAEMQYKYRSNVD